MILKFHVLSFTQNQILQSSVLFFPPPTSIKSSLDGGKNRLKILPGKSCIRNRTSKSLQECGPVCWAEWPNNAAISIDIVVMCPAILSPFGWQFISETVWECVCVSVCERCTNKWNNFRGSNQNPINIFFYSQNE